MRVRSGLRGASTDESSGCYRASVHHLSSSAGQTRHPHLSGMVSLPADIRFPSRRVRKLISYTVRSKHNLRFYAIKVLGKEKIVRMKQESHTRNEQLILQAVQHPFIINLWGTFQDTANLYMVMDFVPGGELFTLLRRSNVGCSPLERMLSTHS